MTREAKLLIDMWDILHRERHKVITEENYDVIQKAINAFEQEPIDKSGMLNDIFMEGVNMSGEYQGCWVRFKDIEKIVDKYIGDKV